MANNLSLLYIHSSFLILWSLLSFLNFLIPISLTFWAYVTCHYLTCHILNEHSWNFSLTNMTPFLTPFQMLATIPFTSLATNPLTSMASFPCISALTSSASARTPPIFSGILLESPRSTFLSSVTVKLDGWFLPTIKEFLFHLLWSLFIDKFWGPGKSQPLSFPWTWKLPHKITKLP